MNGEAEEPERKCAICGKNTTLMLCSKCYSIRYCCKQHQIEHWPVHKILCKKIVASQYNNLNDKNSSSKNENSCGSNFINKNAVNQSDEYSCSNNKIKKISNDDVVDDKNKILKEKSVDKLDTLLKIIDESDSSKKSIKPNNSKSKHTTDNNLVMSELADSLSKLHIGRSIRDNETNSQINLENDFENGHDESKRRRLENKQNFSKLVTNGTSKNISQNEVKAKPITKNSDNFNSNSLKSSYNVKLKNNLQNTGISSLTEPNQNLFQTTEAEAQERRISSTSEPDLSTPIDQTESSHRLDASNSSPGSPALVHLDPCPDTKGLAERGYNAEFFDNILSLITNDLNQFGVCVIDDFIGK